MITSKLTSKSQTTIPQPIRRALQLQPGDDIGYVVQADNVVILKRVEAATDVDPFAEFHEWSSREDDEAYADL